MAKRQHRHTPLRQTRTRTRQNKGAGLLSDPLENTQQLNLFLRDLGLYAAPTVGDGNCQFRALSDQYYGSPSQHLKLRQEVCDWIASHKARYAPFVDDERGLDVHLQCMRQPGTYGGHLELTAFAHLKKRDVKVIQPGLVYVIEWKSGADLSPTTETPPSEQIPVVPPSTLNEREVRKTRREKRKEIKERAKLVAQSTHEDDDEDEDSSLGAIYVAYHDWEHFSSVRNLSGPHVGIPYVVERPAPSAQSKAKSVGKSKDKVPPPQSSSTEGSSIPDSSEEADEPPREPLSIPLLASRTPSPPPSSDASISSTSNPSAPLLPGYNCPDVSSSQLPTSQLSVRSNRSSKRGYNPSDEAAEDSQGESKRSRRYTKVGCEVENSDLDIDPDANTPDLLSSADSSSSGSSPATTPPPSMVIIPPTPVVPTKSLTRRERKKLGLPGPNKLGSIKVAPVRRGKSAGKIIVPGGRFKKSEGTTAAGTDGNKAGTDEWTQNGSGRVDVRGFKELKI